MAIKIESRWAAFGIHLLISVIVLVALLSLIFFVWFPYDLIFAGGIDGLKILMGVDLILGPLLTLIVFKAGKKGLKFDLSMIALLQIACLIAGSWLVYNERPLIQLLADDGVHLLAASDFKQYHIQVGDLPGRSPKHIMLDLPEDRSQLGIIKFSTELSDGKPFSFRDDLYLPLSTLDEQRFQQRIKFIQSDMSQLQLEKLARLEDEECSWVPLVSKHNFGHACTNYGKGIIRLSERNW
jgi:hypothetical protein